MHPKPPVAKGQRPRCLSKSYCRSVEIACVYHPKTHLLEENGLLISN